MVSWIPKTYKAFELKVQERGWKCIDSLMMKDTFVYAWKRGEEMFLVTLKSVTKYASLRCIFYLASCTIMSIPTSIINRIQR